MIDYKKIGFKCGLEIHQRLQTHKLFCNCPSLLRDDKPSFTIKRKLRAVAGESGEVDIAAKHEHEKDLEFFYEGYSDTTCLVELDETPPESLNQEALKIVIQIALLLNCKVLDEIIFMRKTVIDGSNTSGFQRTGLLAVNGYIETTKGRVRIATINLEEEAAKNIKETNNNRIWRLDRLGIPLVEIQTDADIKDPEHAKETAEKIGMLVRSTGKVMRGIGSIRQDVNLSIEGHPRIEIKGFQDIRALTKTIEYEVFRQEQLIKDNKVSKGEVRKANPDFTTSFLRPLPGSARLYPETDLPIYKIPRSLVKSIDLPEPINDKIKRFEKQYSLSKDLASLIIDNTNFENLIKKFKNISPSIIAQTLTLTLKDLETRLDLDISRLNDLDIEEILSYLDENKISKEAIPELLTKKIKNEKINLDHFKTASEQEVLNKIKELKKDKSLTDNAIMGMLMKEYRGKIDGKRLMELIKKG